MEFFLAAIAGMYLKVSYEQIMLPQMLSPPHPLLLLLLDGMKLCSEQNVDLMRGMSLEEVRRNTFLSSVLTASQDRP
jgi:hypothetical protein